MAMASTVSLSIKLIRIGAGLLVIALASIGLTLWVTWQLEGGAAAVNEAGRMRMQTWRLTSVAQSERAPAEVAALVQQFDQSLSLLRQEIGMSEPLVAQGAGGSASFWQPVADLLPRRIVRGKQLRPARFAALARDQLPRRGGRRHPRRHASRARPGTRLARCPGGARRPARRGLERFRAKWVPVRVEKTRQNKQLENFRASEKRGNALGHAHGLSLPWPKAQCQ